MAKLGKCELPASHSFNDFKAFGPPATKDTMFAGTKICDMGCFAQDGVDSNKMYHCSILQSKIDNKWYVYVEYGRVGATKPQFQFTECYSESEAQKAYESQCAEKNTKRGQWESVGGLQVYRPKPGKDLYLVRTMATRSVQITDAKSITVTEVAKPNVKLSGKKSYKCDTQTTKLMRDLMGGTVTYTRSSIQGGAIPVQSALDEGRQILLEAKKRLVKLGHDIDDQVKDKDLRSLSAILYSRIPKIKPLHCADSQWILSSGNIQTWEMDIDAFESALSSGTIEQIEHDDPMAGMPVDMEWIDSTSDLGKWLYDWAPKATGNKHSNVGGLVIHNLWKIRRHGEDVAYMAYLETIRKELVKKSIVDSVPRAVFQSKKRFDLDEATRKAFWEANAALLWHGTRSCNVTGILKTGFKFPNELVGVKITAAMFGPGTYMASDYKKSIGYTSHTGSLYNKGAGSVKGRHSFMLLCDTTLGNPHTAPEAYPFTSYPNGTHSIYGKAGYSEGWHGALKNDEHIIFKKPQQQIKYLVEFSTK